MTSEQFNSSYLSLAPTLYKVAFYILESEEEARDAVQDAFVKLWNDRETLGDVNSPKAYAIRLVKNLCIDRIRRQRLEFPEELPERVSPEGQDDEIDQKERLNMVMEAIKSLPDRQREILWLRTVENLSYDEISERLGMTPLTLRVLLSRARSKIKLKV
ncbi:MAG: sigma-70 family RNA polymerase sigma factor [Bacteroidales bacterium]|nr:sigma-70 family RNA polymerase sigma factor [Bacteroidales bacterium]MBR3500641.1 sigma-70 family RNA polymerase sigma factor [Bacteroidales bacterium]